MTVNTSTSTNHRIIRASAGSGKTYDLTSAYLRLLYHGAPPESIVATTFTRKAAGEILSRIFVRLIDASRNPSTALRLAHDLGNDKLDCSDVDRMLTSLCRTLHRLSVSTIDSLFGRITRCFHFELDIDPQSSLTEEDDPAAVELRARAIDAVLSDADLPLLLELLRALDHDLAPRSVAATLDRLVREMHRLYREAPNPDLWTGPHVPDGLLPTEVLIRKINELQQWTDKSFPDKRIAPAIAQDHARAYARRWREFLGKGVAGKVAQGQDTYQRKLLPTDLLCLYRLLVDHAQADALHRIARQTHAAFLLLQRFDPHDTHLHRQHNLLLFSELPYRLARGLAQPTDDLLTDLCFRLDHRVTHLLLDEFQDTSREQWAVLQPLAQEICAHADGSRTFFCVGDPKQAIYDWRGGCAELFDDLALALPLPPNAWSSKDRSYRSSQVVLNVVNQLFGTLSDNPALHEYADITTKWDSAFIAHESARLELPGYVELITSAPSSLADPPQSDGDSEEENAAESNGSANAHEIFAAQHIAALHRVQPDRSLGVLTRRRDTANRLLFLLRRLGLIASGEGGSALTDNAAVNLILSALQFADHPADTAAAFHLQSSPLAPSLGSNSPNTNHLESLAMTIRQTLLVKGYGQTLTRWARDLAPSCDRRQGARLTQLIELADRYDRAPTLRPSDFVRFIRAAEVEDPLPASVRVMTIHAAKGLEFDAVVLPELDVRTFGRLPAFYVDRPNPTGPIHAVYKSAPEGVRAHSPQLQAAHDAYAARRFRDELCSLYVAMTRPRYALHMIAKPLQLNKNGTARKQPLCYSALLRNGLNIKDEAPNQQQTLLQTGNPDWHRQLPALPTAQTTTSVNHRPQPAIKNSVTGRRSWPRLSPSALPAGGRVSARDLLQLEPSTSRLRGSVIHRWLQMIEWLDEPNTVPPDELLLTAAAQIPFATGHAELDHWLDQFKKLLTQPTIRQIFSATHYGVSTPHLKLWREQEFAVRLNDRLVTGKFDRVVIHDAALRFADLIDFKTDQIQTDNTTRITEHYRPQIDAYRDALATMLRLNKSAIRARLLFVDADIVVEL